MMPTLRDIEFGKKLRADRLVRFALMVAGAWIICCICGWIFQADQFYRSYLFAWLFWVGVTMGALAIVMLHNLLGGEWGLAVRRLGEHAAMTLPLLIVLFIPIAIGMHSLFVWSRADVLAVDPVIRHKQPYLNIAFFLWRAVIYGAIWLAMAWFLRSRSLRHDRTGDFATQKHIHHVSAGGMLVYFLSMSLAGVDWFMSRDPHWVSTIFGFVLILGQSISGLCVLLIVFILLLQNEQFRQLYRPNMLNDLGNLLLTLVILWTYLAFTQLLVIWMGDKQDEVLWYAQRLSNGWWWVGLILLICHFFVPFLVLLQREAKRRVSIMLALCCGLLLLRLIDVFWMVAPSGLDPHPLLRHALSWMDFVFPIGMGAIWLAMFLWLMAGHPLSVEGEAWPIANAPVAQK